MAANGETATGAAARLGLDPKSLRTWLRRVGHGHLWAVMAARDHATRPL